MNEVAIKRAVEVIEALPLEKLVAPSDGMWVIDRPDRGYCLVCPFMAVLMDAGRGDIHPMHRWHALRDTFDFLLIDDVLELLDIYDHSPDKQSGKEASVAALHALLEKGPRVVQEVQR